ncbi:DNA helicase [Cellulomonas hominis]|uniref:DNA 3'-5' helicase n=1 Tax=Cellulomonas hominis TaxID=156981 RepID=A0A511FH38_9CELL|nr:UvrD-helicase domain-containing protein [Cellulomonas hominis]MBB5474725.1 hypothetical protein [Cellulomonas hominis]NKY05987.1 ATP-dependent helicase [Cellulomonas hominis]GEL48575.1 DNA helicase [Cellulomonas hominis]
MGAHPLTDQQQAIVSAVADGQDVAVLALAGTGKTSILAAIAEHLQVTQPQARLLYLAFNKVTADEARGRMPANVEAITANAMAHRSVPGWMHRRMKPRAIPMRELIAELGIDRDVYLGGLRAASPYDLARLTRATMTRWCISADPEPTWRHVPKAAAAEFPELREALTQAAYRARQAAGRAGDDPEEAEAAAFQRHWLKVCQVVLGQVNTWWAKVTDPDGHLAVSFDQEVKFWALAGTRFDQPGSGARYPASIVLLDEAQDTAPVLGALVASQPIQKVIVGDQNQQIYAWRGAVDYLAKVEVDTTLALTRSWRFGSEVAHIANCFLCLLETEERVEGLGPDTDVGPIAAPDAVIVRTNAGLLEQAIDLDRARKVIGVPKGMKADLTSLAETVGHLRDHLKRPSVIHEDLAEFASWGEVLEEARKDSGGVVARIVKLVGKVDIHRLLRLVDRLVDVDQAGTAARYDILITTAHKAKGLEWDAARIGDDFPQPRIDEDGQVSIPAAEELRLAYVAVTRARRALDIGSLGYAMAYQPVDRAELASRTESPTPPQAAEPSRLPQPATPELAGVPDSANVPAAARELFEAITAGHHSAEEVYALVLEGVRRARAEVLTEAATWSLTLPWEISVPAWLTEQAELARTGRV